MDERQLGIVLAAAPAMATAWLAMMVELLPPARNKFDKMINCCDDLDWLAELAFEFAFIGSAAVSFLFAQMDAMDNMLLTGMWFTAWLFFNRLLLRRKKDLEELRSIEAAGVQRRKMAGLMRSIVKSELEKIPGCACRAGALTDSAEKLYSEVSDVPR